MYPLREGFYGGQRGFSLIPVLIIGVALALSLAMPLVAFPASGIWNYTAHDLTTARRYHTATLLPGDQVLVVGGVTYTSEYEYFTSVERFDPAGGGTWDSRTSIPIGRAYHTATLLESGEVLVAGGVGTGIVHLQSAQLYDPKTNTWADTGDLNHKQAAHTATLLKTGKVLICGGLDNYNPEVYDPLEKKWTETEPTEWRVYHTATLLNDGRVLVAGGRRDGGYGGSMDSAVIFNPNGGSWTSVASLKHVRNSHTATLMPNGKVLVAGGYDNHGGYLDSAEIYDPIMDTWTYTAGSLGEARQDHQAVMLDNGMVLVVGGLSGAGTGLASAELYNRFSGKWTATGSLNTGRLWFTATKLNNGQVLAASGYGSSSPTGLKYTAELYDPPPPPPPPGNPGLMLLLLDD